MALVCLTSDFAQANISMSGYDCLKEYGYFSFQHWVILPTENTNKEIMKIRNDIACSYGNKNLTTLECYYYLAQYIFNVDD